MDVNTWCTTLPAECQEHSQGVSEEEYMAAYNNRTDSPQSTIVENGAATEDMATAEYKTKTTTKSSNDSETTGMTTRPAPTKSRKRKAADETATDSSVLKKARKRATKPVDAESTESPAPKRTRKRPIKAEDAAPGDAPALKRRKACKGKGQAKEESIDMPPPPPPPAEVTPPVANKIIQILNYITTHPDSKLDREANTDEAHDCLNIPEMDLTCILSTMYWHYELDSQPENLLLEIEDAIMSRYEERIGTHHVLSNIVHLNVTKMTNLEERIHDKIVRHGLDDKNLLKIEIEMFNERVDERVRFWRPAVQNLLAAVAGGTGDDAETGGNDETGGETDTSGDAGTSDGAETSEATVPAQMVNGGARSSSACQIPLME